VGSSPGFTASHLDFFILSTSGGSGGETFYTLGNNPYCRLSGNSLSADRPTTCVVTARKAASPGFNEVLSSPTQFTFNAFSQAPVTIKYQVPGNSKAESMAIGEVASLESTFTEFSGAGQKSFSVSGNNCFLNLGFSVTASTSTTCVVTATIQGYYEDTRTRIGTGVLRSVRMYFSPVTSVPLSFVFDYRDQAPLFIFSPITTAKAGEGPIYLSTYGGSGTGTVSYSVISGGCSISGSPTNQYAAATGATTCVITATKAGRPSGYKSAVTSQPVTLYFTAP
jgi:hypothetical protein